MANTDFEDFDIEEFLIKAPLYKQLIEEYLNNVCKKVICIESGIIYDSIKSAEELTGFCHSNISRCCRGIYSNCGGLHFYFIDNDDNILYTKWYSKRKKVIRLEGLIIYNNVEDAAKLNNTTVRTIRSCCYGDIAHIHGYHFEYYNENKKYQNLLSQYKKPDQGSLKVQCVETQKVYNSIREAARQTNATHEGIRLCCNKKGKTSGGLHWQFYLEP